MVCSTSYNTKSITLGNILRSILLICVSKAPSVPSVLLVAVGELEKCFRDHPDATFHHQLQLFKAARVISPAFVEAPNRALSVDFSGLVLFKYVMSKSRTSLSYKKIELGATSLL